VPGGHDRFSFDLVEQLLGRSDIFNMHEDFCCAGELNMTYRALNLSHYVNGDANKHDEVPRHMLVPKDTNHHYDIDQITHGVHASTWTAVSLAELFDRYLTGWREDNASLRGVLAIQPNDIWEAHQIAKHRLIDEISSRDGILFDPETITLGFARRATAYKRANLLISDPTRQNAIVKGPGRFRLLSGSE